MLAWRKGFPEEWTTWALLGLKDVTCSVGGEDNGNDGIVLGLMLPVAVEASVVRGGGLKLVTMMTVSAQNGRE